MKSSESDAQLAKTSLSEIFKQQIKECDPVTTVRILKIFKRIERMVGDLDRYSLDVGKMTMKVKVGGGLSVVVQALPHEDKIVVKKILWR